MNLYIVTIDGHNDNVLGYEFFDSTNNSLRNINDKLKGHYMSFPLLNGNDITRLRGAGGTLLWSGDNMERLYWLVDIDYKDEGQWRFDDLPQRFDKIGKTIKRDIKIRQVI